MSHLLSHLSCIFFTNADGAAFVRGRDLLVGMQESLLEEAAKLKDEMAELHRGVTSHVRELRRIMEGTYDGPSQMSLEDVSLELLLVHDGLDGAVSRRCMAAKSSTGVLSKCVQRQMEILRCLAQPPSLTYPSELLSLTGGVGGGGGGGGGDCRGCGSIHGGQ